MNTIALHDPNITQRHLAVIAEPQLPQIAAGFFDAAGFDLMQRIAKGFSSSSLVPKEYQGNTPSAIANCMIALNIARRMNADPLMVMQNLSIVQGRPCWSGKFLIASANTCGRFSALRFEFFGEKGQPDWGCRASAIETATGEVLTGSDITWKLAVDEGWTKRGGSKWLTMPQQMFMYRAGAWWVNAYAPEISMGLMTAEESHDVGPVEYRELRRDAPAARKALPRTINARLEAPIADEIEESAPIIDDEIPDFSARTTSPQPPAEASTAGEPASSTILPGTDDAGTPDRIEVARAAGRKACRAGVPYDAVPKEFSRYILWGEAWQDGHADEGEKMEAEVRQ